MTSTISTTLRNLFAPVPEEPTSPSEHSTIDRIAKYTKSREGAKDCFRVADTALSWAVQIPTLSDSTRSWLQKADNVAQISSGALSLPSLVSDGHALSKSVHRFCEARNLSHSDPLRERKVVRAGKNAVIDGMSLAYTCSEAASFLHNTSIVDLTRYLPAIGLVGQGTSVITDGNELIEEAYKVQAYKTAQAATRNPTEIARYKEKTTLSKMKIIKDAASVSASAIGVVAILFGIATASITLIATIVLILSTLWLAMKIASYFYEKMIEERQARMVPV